MAQQNLTLIRGDTNIFDATVTLNSAPLDITTYDVWCTAKYSKDDTDIAALFQLTKTGGAITVVGANNNVARINIPASATLALTADVSVFYDVQIKAAGVNGQITTVAEGTMLISRDVTRAVT